EEAALFSPGDSAHIPAMAKSPDDPAGKPKRDPAKHSKKDPAKPTRAKASRPNLPSIAPALEKLLNPGIAAGTAGPGSQTGLRQPAGNSRDRRADEAAAHQARASTPQGFGESAQRGYVTREPVEAPPGIDPELAEALGFDKDS